MRWVWFLYEKSLRTNRAYDSTTQCAQSPLLSILQQMLPSRCWLFRAHERCSQSTSMEYWLGKPSTFGYFANRTSFWGALKTYEIAVGANDLDLLHVMHIKRQEIENIVRLSVQQHSKKFNSAQKYSWQNLQNMMMKFLQVNQIESQCIYSQKWNV